MSRSIDAAVQAALEKTERTEVLLVFVTVTIPNVSGAIRIVSEENKGVSYANGLPINYVLDSELFTGLPFGFSRLSDDDRPARGAINVPAFSNDIGDFLRTIADPARLLIQIYPLSGWDLTVDPTTNARSPTGTPELVWDADHLFLRDANGGQSVIQCTLGGYDFTQEPLGPRATKDLCPDLYR